MKIRIKGKVRRKYHKAKTPYQNIMESSEISEEKKQKLREIYESLNPAQLKRNIDKKLNMLYKAYQEKNKSQKVELNKTLKPCMVRFSKVQLRPVSVRRLNDLTRII